MNNTWTSTVAVLWYQFGTPKQIYVYWFFSHSSLELSKKVLKKILNCNWKAFVVSSGLSKHELKTVYSTIN